MSAPQKFAIGIVVILLVSGLCYAVAVDKAAEGARVRKERIEQLEITKKRREEAERKLLEQKLLESSIAVGKSSKFFVDNDKFDLGDIAPHSEVKHRFVVRNDGEGPLSVKLLKTSCSCTLGRMAKGVLLPNESTEIELAFQSGDHLGDFSHGADLSTNDPDRPAVQLVLSGRVRFEYHADPSPVSFTNFGPHDVRSQEVLLTSGAFESFEIVSIATKEIGITHEYEPLTPEEIDREKVRSGYRLKITYGIEAESKVRGNLVLSLLGKGEKSPKEVKLPIVGDRSSVLEVTGSDTIDATGAITLGNLVHGKSRKLTFTVKARGLNKKLTVRKTEVDPPFMKVSPEPNEKTGSAAITGLHLLHIEIPDDAPEGNYQGKFAGKIHFEFDDPEYGSLTLNPVFAIVAEKED